MKKDIGKFFLFAVFIYLIIKSCFGFHNIAWGTGLWWGEYSLKWGVAFFLYIAFCASLVVIAEFLLWQREKFQKLFEKMLALR